MTFHEMFLDIRIGFSKVNVSNKTFYIKHLGIDENAQIEEFYYSIYEKSISSGRLSRKKILEKCEKDGSWSTQDQDSFDNLTRDIKAFSQKRNSVPNSIQELWSINDELKEMHELVNKLELKKLQLTSSSAESYAEERTIEKRIEISFYNDKLLKEKTFTQEDLEYVDDTIYSEFLNKYLEFLSNFSPEKIKMLSVRKFVQNLFSVTQDEFKIFNMPIIDLTTNQIQLLRNGKYYRSLLDEIREIEDDDIVNPERIEEVYLENKIPKKEKKYSS